MNPATDEQIGVIKIMLTSPHSVLNRAPGVFSIVQSLIDRIEQDQEELSIYKLSSGSGVSVESIKRLMEI